MYLTERRESGGKRQEDADVRGVMMGEEAGEWGHVGCWGERGERGTGNKAN